MFYRASREMRLRRVDSKVISGFRSIGLQSAWYGILRLLVRIRICIATAARVDVGLSLCFLLSMAVFALFSRGAYGFAPVLAGLKHPECYECEYLYCLDKQYEMEPCRPKN